jgi:hypothetical protein
MAEGTEGPLSRLVSLSWSYSQESSTLSWLSPPRSPLEEEGPNGLLVGEVLSCLFGERFME